MHNVLRGEGNIDYLSKTPYNFFLRQKMGNVDLSAKINQVLILIKTNCKVIFIRKNR